MKKLIFAAALISALAVLFACAPKKNKTGGQGGTTGTTSTVSSSASSSDKNSSQGSEKDNGTEGKSTAEATVVEGEIEFPEDWF